MLPFHNQNPPASPHPQTMYNERSLRSVSDKIILHERKIQEIVLQNVFQQLRMR